MTSIPAEFFLDICRDLLNVVGPTQVGLPRAPALTYAPAAPA